MRQHSAEYSAYLESDAWRALRAEVVRRAVIAASRAGEAGRWTSIMLTATATWAGSTPRNSKHVQVTAMTPFTPRIGNSFGCLRSLVWVVLITIAIELAWWFLVMPLHQAGVF